MWTKIVVSFALVSSGAFAANNNDWPKVKEDCALIFHPTPVQPAWKAAMACGQDFFTARPVHLTVKSIVPGGGFGLGPTYTQPLNSGKWQQDFTATGVGTMRQFWQTEAAFSSSHDHFGANSSARDRFAYSIYAKARDLPQMTYYGIGPSTATSAITNFQERDVTAGADVFNPFSAWFAAGARFESIWPDVNGVNDPGVRNITTYFNESTAPGLTKQPNLLRYGAYVEPRRQRGKFQFDYKIGYDFYQDHDTGHYSFRRFSVDGTHTFHPTGRAEDILTIHDRLAITDTSHGSVVPFYMLQTLGGSDIDGQPTLRGFSDYRFRGPDLTLIQVQYDHRIWGPLGVLGFYDTGQVATQVSDLSLAKMRHSYGFGVAIWAGDRPVFRVFVGLGSGEGHHTYVGIPSF